MKKRTVKKKSPITSRTSARVELDRTVLPLAEPTHPPIQEIDVRKATSPPRFEVKSPQGAPNVLLILLDNLGFGATRTFGGVIRRAGEKFVYGNQLRGADLVLFEAYLRPNREQPAAGRVSLSSASARNDNRGRLRAKAFHDLHKH